MFSLLFKGAVSSVGIKHNIRRRKVDNGTQYWVVIGQRHELHLKDVTDHTPEMVQ